MRPDDLVHLLDRLDHFNHAQAVEVDRRVVELAT